MQSIATEKSKVNSYQELSIVSRPKQESPLEFAEKLQTEHQETIPSLDRKNIGQYFTPTEVARFMAGLFDQIPSEAKILDPGAGAGILSAAISERVLNSRKKHKLDFHLYEIDPQAIILLRKTTDYCKNALEQKGHEATFTIYPQDFILHTAQSLSGQQMLHKNPVESQFNLIIMNPPYFKLKKNSRYAKLLSSLFNGQPNIYAQFMALGAHLLRKDGELVAITPRSYCNGLYFKGFRKYLLQTVKPKKIHVFESRNKAFDADGVLQENIIVCFKKTVSAPSIVRVSVSDGYHDLEHGKIRNAPYEHVIHTIQDDTFIRIMSDAKEREASRVIDSFDQTFLNEGYRISTGPVVSFRLKEHLRFKEEKGAVPLITIHDVQPFKIVPHKKTNKPSFFAVDAASKSWVTPMKNYVLLRRFTAKEEKRRLTAAVFLSKNVEYERVAFENHLNYVYKANGTLTEDEVYGLAALFNSKIYDDYFRAISGNTQVNAHEIKHIKLPPNEVILRIGKTVKTLATQDIQKIENAVRENLLKMI